jgi:carboxypeptidase family protein
MLKRDYSAGVLSVLIAIAMMAGHGLAQSESDSSLRVMVLDPTGAAIVAAKVEVREASGQQRMIETGARGESVFTRLAPGHYKIHVEAEGFEARDLKDFQVRPGRNSVEIKLEIARVSEKVEVTPDEREKKVDPRGTSFTNVLTPEQIAQLPDDPEEMEAALRQMAGPGATFRVNGFRGGKLPPKSQIREIRFRMNQYAADTHEPGFFSVDIFTKPGLDSWHGSINLGFRDESLNARNSFAPSRGPEQNRRFGLSVDGPLWPRHTSLSLNADGTDSYDSKTIVAALPDANFAGTFRRPSRTLNLSARIEHALTKTHTLHGEYQRNAGRQDNLGVGDFDLPDRAYSSDNTEHLFRLVDSGPLAKRLVNEFRLQARWQQIARSPASNSPAVLVLNAFNQGGAQIDGSRRVRELEVGDNSDFAFGKHSLRTGVLLEAFRYHSDERQNANGTFVFASLADFRASRPTTYTQRVGDPLVEFSQYQLGWYLQDDYRVRKNLTASLGLRHEFQTNLDDQNNFAPRFGLSWSPFKDGKTTIRAGAAIFYDWFAAETFEQTLRVDGLRQTEIVVNSPGFPDPFGGGTPGALPPSRIERDPALVMPYLEQASIGVERQLTKSVTVRTNYFYQHGVHLLRGRNINAPIPVIGRPDPAAGNITQVESSASSSMHGFIVGVNFQQPQRRIFGGINYFLSKSVNETDGPLGLPADNLDPRADRGPAPGDARHRLFGMLNMQLAGGLRIGTVFNASSALPYNITTGFDDNLDSVSNDRTEGVGRNSARGSAQWNVGTRLAWGFGFGARQEPAAQGGRPRIVRIGPDSDVLGSMPSIPGGVSKRYRMEFYVQANNLFNHANLISYSGVQTSPFFGQATAAQPARRIETGMRFSF